MIKDYKENNCLFIDHGVDMRQKIFGSGDVIIMGDVEKGAIIKAGGNIIVLGRLYGQALAGNNPDVKEPFIMANDFFPENFRIGSVLGDVPKRKKSVLKKDQRKFPWPCCSFRGAVSSVSSEQTGCHRSHQRCSGSD